MAEYSSLKVPELKKLLAEKGLSQTGNKADLVARLNEHDKQDAAEEDKPEATEANKPAEAKEDEITYSDDETADAKPAATEAAPQPDKAESKDTSDEPKPAAEDAAPGDAEKPAAEAPSSYAMGLSSTTADDEAKKRAERAKRFGVEENEESRKRADRAKRFGIDEKELASGLDSALPERSLKRGRGRGEGDGSGRPGKRQSLDRRGGRRRGGRHGGGGGGGDGDAGAPPKSVILDDPAEKAKAEKRAARFAAA